MQHKRLVIDANILIRGVFGTRVRELIVAATEEVAFYVAEANYREACHYLAELAPRRRLADPVWKAALETLTTTGSGLELLHRSKNDADGDRQTCVML